MLVEFYVRNYATLDGLVIYGANEIFQGSTKVFNSGPYSLKCTKILSQHHLFLFFLPSPFLPCKDTFMDDYDRIYNCNGLKYNISEIFDNF
jgi:hypothetical protein